jgi:hypothetical protein
MRHVTPHADVTTRALSSVMTSGGARVRVTNSFSADTFQLTASGGATFRAAIDVAAVEVELSGAARACCPVVRPSSRSRPQAPASWKRVIFK